MGAKGGGSVMGVQLVCSTIAFSGEEPSLEGEGAASASYSTGTKAVSWSVRQRLSR